MSRNQISLFSCDYASCAPLPVEYVDFIIQDQKKRLGSRDLPPPSPSFHQLRHDIFLNVATAAEAGKLNTTWLARELTELTPQKVKVRRQTINNWKNANIVRYDGEERPEFHSAAALLLARHYSPLLREWRPSALDQDATWYCWLETEPGSKPLMVAFSSLVESDQVRGESRLVKVLDPETVEGGGVFPQLVRVPNSSLLYTGWEGAARTEGWYKVDGGAVRFLGPVTEDDLAQWNEHMKPFGVTEEEAPDIFQTAKLLVLQILARPRLLQECERVLWQKY